MPRHPTVEEILALDGIDAVRKKHPVIAEQALEEGPPEAVFRAHWDPFAKHHGGLVKLFTRIIESLPEPEPTGPPPPTVDEILGLKDIDEVRELLPEIAEKALEEGPPEQVFRKHWAPESKHHGGLRKLFERILEEQAEEAAGGSPGREKKKDKKEKKKDKKEKKKEKKERKEAGGQAAATGAPAPPQAGQPAPPAPPQPPAPKGGICFVTKTPQTPLGITWKLVGSALTLSKVKENSPALRAGAEKWVGFQLVAVKMEGCFDNRAKLETKEGTTPREAENLIFHEDNPAKLAKQIILSFDPPGANKGKKIGADKGRLRQDKLDDAGYDASPVWSGPRAGKYFGRGAAGVGYYDLPVYPAGGGPATVKEGAAKAPAPVQPQKPAPPSLMGAPLKLGGEPLELKRKREDVPEPSIPGILSVHRTGDVYTSDHIDAPPAAAPKPAAPAAPAAPKVAPPQPKGSLMGAPLKLPKVAAPQPPQPPQSGGSPVPELVASFTPAGDAGLPQCVRDLRGGGGTPPPPAGRGAGAGLDLADYQAMIAGGDGAGRGAGGAGAPPPPVAGRGGGGAPPPPAAGRGGGGAAPPVAAGRGKPAEPAKVEPFGAAPAKVDPFGAEPDVDPELDAMMGDAPSRSVADASGGVHQLFAGEETVSET